MTEPNPTIDSHQAATHPADGTPDREEAIDGTDPAVSEDADPAGARPRALTAANREAARYRVRAQEAEAEREGLQARVDALTRGAVESVIRDDKTIPLPHRFADMIDVAGINIGDLLDENGVPDPDKVRDALTTVQHDRGYLFADRPDPGVPLWQIFASHTAGHERATSSPGSLLQSAHQEALRRQGTR